MMKQTLIAGMLIILCFPLLSQGFPKKKKSKGFQSASDLFTKYQPKKNKGYISQEFQDFKAFLKDFEIFVRLVTNIMSLMPNIEENQESNA